MALAISGAIDSTVSLSNCFSGWIGSVLVTMTSLIAEFFSRSTAGPDSTPCVAVTMTWAAPCSNRISAALAIVDPVSIMSSTRMQVRPATCPTTSSTWTLLATSGSRRLWMIAGGLPRLSVHRTVEEALDLRRVQVDGHQGVRSRRPEQVGHQPGRDRLAAAALLVLPRVAEQRRHHRDPVGRRPLERVDHDELLHDPLVDRRGVTLQHEGVAAPDRLEEAHEDLAVGEVEQGGGGRLDAEVVGDLQAELGVRPAGEQHHLLAGWSDTARHVTCSFTRCANGPTRAPAGITADSQTDWITVAPGPTSVSRSRQPGPT